MSYRTEEIMVGFEEALKALVEGRRVTRKGFNFDFRRGGKTIVVMFTDRYNNPPYLVTSYTCRVNNIIKGTGIFNISLEDILAKDWYILDKFTNIK